MYVSAKLGARLLYFGCKLRSMGSGLSCKAVFLCPGEGEKLEVCFSLGVLSLWMQDEDSVHRSLLGWKPDRTSAQEESSGLDADGWEVGCMGVGTKPHVTGSVALIG